MTEYRKDEEGRAFHDLLSDTDLKMQEIETQRILEKVRGRAKGKSGAPSQGKTAASKAWGAPNVYDDQIQRSVSRPLMSPTNRAARDALRSASAEKRHQRGNSENEGGLPPTAMLAPSGLTIAPPSTAPSSPGGFNRTSASLGSSLNLSGTHQQNGLVSPIRPMTAGALLSASSTASKKGPPPQSSRAMVAKLEAEVKHLRETIGVLLESETSAPASAGKGGRKSILKKARPETAPAMRTAAVGSDHGSAEQDDGNGGGSSMGAGVEEVLGEKERAERRVMALEKAKRRLAATTKALSEEAAKPVLGMPSSPSPAATAAILAAAGGPRSTGRQPPGSARSATARSRLAASGVNGESKEDGGDENHGIASPNFGDTMRSSATTSNAAGLVAAAAEHAFRDDIDSDDERERRRPLTKPQEFSFMQRLREQKDKLSISARRLEEERRAKEREEEEAKKQGFKAKPVPAAAKLPLFSLLMNKQEERRRQEHEARMAAASSSTQPFNQLMEHEEQMRARRAAARARLELAQQKELAEGRRFKAIPVPATTTAPDGAYMRALKREAERPVRVAASARALAATASLPPRMALAQEAEKRRKIERQASQKAQEASERRMARFRANSLPDFSNMHASIEMSMRDTRKAFAPTLLMPFSFDSEERHAAERAREEARRREYELLTSPSPALRALATSGGNAAAVGGKLGMTRSLGGAEFEATMRSGFTTGSRRGSKAGSVDLNQAPPPAAMTRTVQLRMLEVQRRVRERQEEERLQAIEDEARAKKIREATRAIAPIVQRLEAERNPIPLAWHGSTSFSSTAGLSATEDGSPMNAVALAKKEFERKAKQNMREQKKRVEEAERARPLLMLRSSLDLRKEEARRAALISAAKKIGEPSGQAAWESVVNGALGSTSRSAGGRSTAQDDTSAYIHDDDEGEELFNEEERELLGLNRSGASRAAGNRSYSAR